MGPMSSSGFSLFRNIWKCDEDRTITHCTTTRLVLSICARTLTDVHSTCIYTHTQSLCWKLLATLSSMLWEQSSAVRLSVCLWASETAALLHAHARTQSRCAVLLYCRVNDQRTEQMYSTYYQNHPLTFTPAVQLHKHNCVYTHICNLKFFFCTSHGTYCRGAACSGTFHLGHIQTALQSYPPCFQEAPSIKEKYMCLSMSMYTSTCTNMNVYEHDHKHVCIYVHGCVDRQE